MKQVLPPASFVDFQAHRLRRPLLQWENRALPPEQELTAFAYAVPLAGDGHGFHDDSKTFAADRYGGWAISANGGGARCGTIGAVQVKGIGRNPLGGSGTAFWHSYGGATLAETIRDAIWGEVCHIALPYGAVRAHGIIATNTDLPVHYPRPGGPSHTPRALLVRQAPVRPAHFMRAVYFRRADELRHGLVRDALRTREAIGVMAAAFTHAYGWTARGMDDAEAINQGLLEMYRRLARQSALAFSRKIMHGALSPSNVCLDGRWVDFGTISALSDYGRVVLARNLPDQWRQHRPLHGMAGELRFYLEKYAPPQLAARLIGADQLSAWFRQHYDAYQQTEMLKLTGVPEASLRLLESGLQRTLYAVLLKIIKRGNSEPFKLKPYCPWHVPAMPDKMGAFHLSSLMSAAAPCTTLAELHAVSHAHLGPGLDQEFAGAYWALRSAYLQRWPHATLFLAANSVRLNSVQRELFGTELDVAIQQLVDGGGAVAPFIDGVVARAAACLAPLDGAVLPMGDAGGGRVLLSEAGHAACLPAGMTARQLFDQGWGPLCSHPAAWSAAA